MVRQGKFKIMLFVFAGIIIGLFVASNFDTQRLTLAENPPIPAEEAKLLDNFSAILSQVSEKVTPSIVSISSTRAVKMDKSQLHNFFDDQFFERFFGDRFKPQPFDHPREFNQSGLGSGVIVSEDGYILTNNHVVQDADKLTVTFADGDEISAEVIGSDPKSDLALLKIDRTGLPAAKLGNSDTLKTGEIVLAIGIPFGLSQTVTMGIVSAVGRSNVGIVDYEDFIQTDAAINPGNSGGALVNTRGELVGINTAIFSTSGGYMGVGFAIPIKMAKSVMQSLIEHGKVVRGWLGVSIQDITQDLAKYFNIEHQKGVLIADVGSDTPASEAGVKRGDIITHMDGVELENTADLRNLVAGALPGTTVQLTIIRQGDKKIIDVKLGEFPEQNSLAEKSLSDENVFKGLHLNNLSASSRQSQNIPSRINGVLVSQIEPESSAYGILRPGDIIMQINQEDIGSLADFNKRTSKIDAGKEVLLLIYRKGVHLYVSLEP